jgi:hypothetical protein
VTNREAAIICAYTGISFGGSHFSHFHQYVEEKFGRSVWTHEMAEQSLWDDLKELSKDDFIELAKNIRE